MKKLLLLAFGMGIQYAHAQISVGAVGMTIKGGTAVYMDSLVLSPTADYTISNTTVTRTNTPIVSGANQSIKQVHTITPSITAFTGTIDMYYGLPELNGNTASALQIAYNPNQTGNTGFVTTSGGTVNTGTQKITQTGFVNKTIGRVTAVNAAVPLPVELTAFRATLFSSFVGLEWEVADNEPIEHFDVEMSRDAENWSRIAQVTATSGRETYSAADGDMKFTTKYYRLRVVHKNGVAVYSAVQKVMLDETSTTKLAISNSGSSVHFVFGGSLLPGSLVVKDVLGRIVWQNDTSRKDYQADGIVPGTYIAVYTINNIQESVKFIVP